MHVFLVGIMRENTVNNKQEYYFKAERLARICATSFLSASGAAAFPSFVVPDPSNSGLGLAPPPPELETGLPPVVPEPETTVDAAGGAGRGTAGAVGGVAGLGLLEAAVLPPEVPVANNNKIKKT